MKTIDTLIEDIGEVIKGNGGWDETITKFLADGIATVASERFTKADTESEPRNTLSMSSIGQPCKRKLWYRVHLPHTASEASAESLGTFFYGDLLEVLVLALAKAAGHRVEGMQDTMYVGGIKGHRDAVIDGVTIDVKSASSYSFQKFEQGNLREDDPFGYISQLSSYVAAGKDDPLVEDKTTGAFLVIRKDRFKLCLDKYNFTEEIDNKEDEVNAIKELMKGPLPIRGFDDEPDGYYKGRGTSREFIPNGNRVLSFGCSFCEYKDECWEGLRKFKTSNPGKPIKYFTKIIKEPRLEEIKDD